MIKTFCNWCSKELTENNYVILKKLDKEFHLCQDCLIKAIYDRKFALFLFGTFLSYNKKKEIERSLDE